MEERILVHLDFVLLHKAKRLINGANVHLGNELIIGYEFAVSLHNSGSHVRYQDQHEKDLRNFVARNGRKVA